MDQNSFCIMPTFFRSVCDDEFLSGGNDEIFILHIPYCNDVQIRILRIKIYCFVDMLVGGLF